jgi:hypothetical protein
VIVLGFVAATAPRAAAQVLPAPWVNADVGSPRVSGSASVSSGTFTVNGSGTDIWKASDQFHFVYQPIDGDLEIVARVASIQQVHQGSKAGVMIRAALTASAPNAFMTGTAAKGWAFQRRLVSGGSSINTPGSFSNPPGWVKLVRSGDTFSGYESIDGSTWVLVDTETIQMPQTVYVGLAVTSHNARKTARATFTNVTAAPVQAENEPPSVTLIAPAPGTTYTAPATVTFQATATDPDGTVSQVDFYAGGQKISSDAAGPYSATWNNVPAGTYDLTAVATDDAGAAATSSMARVTVKAATNQPPAIAITAPANGASYTAPATMTINANATDSDGTVTRVDFFRGSTLIASDATAPYSVPWSNVAAGSYALTAVAFDNAGASTSSAAVNVTVSSALLPTKVAFTPSPDHATGVTSYSVALRRATDPVGATPVASKNLGKPTPVDNEITVDISDIVNPLAAGSYYAVVTAIGSAGSSASTPSATFTR